MEEKYLLFLLGFDVLIRDRRTNEDTDGFIVVPFPEEHPEDLADAVELIKRHYGRLGFDVREVHHQDSHVKAIDLVAEYDAAPPTNEFCE